MVSYSNVDEMIEELLADKKHKISGRELPCA